MIATSPQCDTDQYYRSFRMGAFPAPDINQALAYWKVMLGISGHNDASMMLQAQIMSLPHLFSMLLCAIMVWQPVQAYDWVKNLRGYKYALTGAAIHIGNCSNVFADIQPIPLLSILTGTVMKINAAKCFPGSS